MTRNGSIFPDLLMHGLLIGFASRYAYQSPLAKYLPAIDWLSRRHGHSVESIIGGAFLLTSLGVIWMMLRAIQPTEAEPKRRAWGDRTVILCSGLTLVLLRLWYAFTNDTATSIHLHIYLLLLAMLAIAASTYATLVGSRYATYCESSVLRVTVWFPLALLFVEVATNAIATWYVECIRPSPQSAKYYVELDAFARRGADAFRIVSLMAGAQCVATLLWMVVCYMNGRPRVAGGCIACGYQLRGLRERRCPECGRQF